MSVSFMLFVRAKMKHLLFNTGKETIFITAIKFSMFKTCQKIFYAKFQINNENLDDVTINDKKKVYSTSLYFCFNT